MLTKEITPAKAAIHKQTALRRTSIIGECYRAFL